MCLKSGEKFANLAALASLLPHLFCCVLPAVSSLAGVGAVAGMSILQGLHIDWVHKNEMTLLVFSGVMIALSGAFQLYSRKINCHDTGCDHGPCEPRKNKARWAFWIALGLFVINLAVHFLMHEH
jgi:hypothetical protein